MNYRRTIAIDFDGCLCENAFPEIGKPYLKVIEKAKELKKQGELIILWTCREDTDRPYLTEAVEFCKEQGLTFDAINDNPFNIFAINGKQSRKLFANEYWDDRAVVVRNGEIYHLEEC